MFFFISNNLNQLFIQLKKNIIYSKLEHQHCPFETELV
jgi:hypothetical protein